jgi:hypothetical protein
VTTNLIEELVRTVISEIDAGSKRQRFNFILCVSGLRQMEHPVKKSRGVKLLTEQVAHAGFSRSFHILKNPDISKRSYLNATNLFIFGIIGALGINGALPP